MKDSNAIPLKASPPEPDNGDAISVRAFNQETCSWEYMQLRHRRDYVGGRGYRYSYQRIDAPGRGIDADDFGTCRRLGLIKIVDEYTARVLWHPSANDQAA